MASVATWIALGVIVRLYQRARNARGSGRFLYYLHDNGRRMP